MKAAICLLTLCLAGYVSSDHYAWKMGKQYVYGVQARLFAGIQTYTQYSGLQVRYTIKLTVTGPNTLHLNPSNFQVVELNSDLGAGWRDGELQNETPAEIKPQLLQYLESPIELKMREGIVEKIVVEGRLPTWAINIKKAQASYFVADTTSVNVVLEGNQNRQSNSVRPEEANQESGFFYETMEETVHGECETYYTISQNGPFDWPFQFEQQQQPGQKNVQSQEQVNQNNDHYGGHSQIDKNNLQSEESRENEESNENNENTHHQKHHSSRPRRSVGGNIHHQSDENGSSEEYKGQQYAAFEQFNQRDSGSVEDSKEDNQGERPWPQAFAKFCNSRDQVYQIIKSVNFTTCKNKPVLVYSTNAGLYGRAGDNNIGSSLTRALITRYLACGKDRKQFTILKIEQEEQVNSGLRLDQKILAGAVQNLTLKSVVNAQPVQPIRQPKTIEDLTYTFDPKEQQLQRDGKLQHAYADVNEDNSGSDETNQNQYHGQEKSRKPRSVSDEQNSKESNEGSEEKFYKTNAEGRETLKQPSLRYPPVTPLLVSPLQVSGMKKRVQDLMKEIVVDITTDKQPMAEAETLSKISTVAKIMRHLCASDILNLYHQLAAKSQTSEDQTSRSVFLDALGISGTSPSMVTLFNLIKSGDISGEEASQILMAIPMYIRTPTQALLREFFTVVESPAVEKSQQLKTTAILSFSNTLYQAYVNLRIGNSKYPVAQYGEFGNEKDVQRLYVPYFKKNLENYLQQDQSEGSTKHWIITYLTAFGNLGVEDIIPQVQKLIDDSGDAYIKTHAVMALHRCIVSRSTQNIPVNQVHGVDRNGRDAMTDEVVEKQVMPVLMSVAFDRGEHPEVRMAAISLLLYTTSADVTIWQQLAYSTWFSSSQEVHSFIYSSLKSLAYLDQQVPNINWHMQQKARAVLALAKPITPGYAKSRNSFAAGAAEHLQSNYIHHLSYFGSKDSNIPNYIFYNNVVQYGNRALGVSPLAFGIHGHTIQKLAYNIIEQYRKNQNIQNEQESHKDLEKIYKLLGINNREQDQDIQGSFNLKLRDQAQRIWSINEEVIERYIKQAKEQGLAKMLNGIPINYQKTVHAAEHVFEMPTGFGVPVTVNFKMPVHISVRGYAKLVHENNFKDIQLQAQVHPVFAFKTHQKISFKVPFTGKQYQSGIQRHFVAETPFRALIRKAEQGQIVVAFTPSQLGKGSPSGVIPLATFHQKPYTAMITDSLWPTTHKEGGEMTIVHSGQTPFKRVMNFGEKASGFAFQSQEVSEYRQQNERSSGWIKFWQRFHSQACFFQLGWLGGEHIRYVERSLTLDVSKSETKTIAFVFAGKRHQSASTKDLWQDSNSGSSQSSEENRSVDSQQNVSVQQNSNEQDHSSSGQQRQHRKDSSSGATHSSEDLSQGGFIVAAAMIGKRAPIRPVVEGKGSIQKILEKGSQSTVQYFVQFSKSSGRVYIRAATGDAANEAGKALPQTSKSLQALSEALAGSSNSKAQENGCVEFEGEYDAPKWANRGELLVLRKRLLAQDLAVKVKAEFQFGQGCSKAKMPYEIKVQGKLERGPQMTEYAQSKSRQAQQCGEDEKKGFSVSPVCMEVAEQQAAALNKGQFKIVFSKLPKQFINRTDDAEDFAKALFYPYVSTDRFHQGAGDNQLQVEFHLTPNREFLDVHITKPHSKLSFRAVKTNRAIRAVLPLTATQSLANNLRDRALRSESEPSCSLEKNFLNTFDNVTYRFNQDAAQNCYHVLAQDCSQRQPIAVLVKDIATNQKKVVIYLSSKTKIELTPQGSNSQSSLNAKLQVEINDQRVESLPRVIRSKQSGKEIARIELMNDRSIQVISRYLDVATDGKKIVVFAANALRNRTCGLCGDFNGEKVGDMKSPNNCPLSSGSLLVASYAFKAQDLNPNEQGQCKIDSQLQKQVKQENNQCHTDVAYLPNNPPMFPGAQNNHLQQSACIEELKAGAHKAIYKTVNNILKPFYWFSGKRNSLANQAADKASEKIGEFLGEGSAKKISDSISSAVCNAFGVIPIAGPIVKVICGVSKGLVSKAVLLAVNPICKKTGCCTPTLRNFEPAEYQMALDFAFDDESNLLESSGTPYLNAAEAVQDCKIQLELIMSRSTKYLMHALLQSEIEWTESQRQSVAKKAGVNVRLAVKEALRNGGNISNAIAQAAVRDLPIPVDYNNYLPTLRVTSKLIIDQLCQVKTCCFPGQ